MQKRFNFYANLISSETRASLKSLRESPLKFPSHPRVSSSPRSVLKQHKKWWNADFRYFLILIYTMVCAFPHHGSDGIIKKNKFHGEQFYRLLGHGKVLLSPWFDNERRKYTAKLFSSLPLTQAHSDSRYRNLCDLNSFVTAGLKPVNRMSDILKRCSTSRSFPSIFPTRVSWGQGWQKKLREKSQIDGFYFVQLWFSANHLCKLWI